MKLPRILLSLALLTTLAMLTGCASPKPVFIHKSFDPKAVSNIAVLPFIDAQQHPDPKIDFNYVASETTTMLMPVLRVRLKKEIGGVLAESDGQINAQNT